MEIKGSDLTGVGKVAKSIPDKAWNKLVATACETFEKIIYPITATTSGMGGLIKAKFDQLINEEKVLVAEVFKVAEVKAKGSKKEKKKEANPHILITVINQSAIPTDNNIRELWGNLLAREISQGGVHPEIANILTRINSDDAIRLIEITELPNVIEKNERNSEWGISFQLFKEAFMNVSTMKAYIPREDTFSEKLLENLNLIKKRGDGWILTPIGREFIKSVSDPSKS
jgi:hypothetical protein